MSTELLRRGSSPATRRTESAFVLLVLALWLMPAIAEAQPCVQPVASTVLEFDAGAHHGEFEVNNPSGCPWTVDRAALPDWVEITSAADGMVRFTVNGNPGTTPRGAVVRAGSHVTTVVQGGTLPPCGLTAAPGVVLATPGGGTHEVRIRNTGGCNWFVNIVAPWVRWLPGDTAGSAEAVVRLAVDANATGSTRATLVQVHHWWVTVVQPSEVGTLPATFTLPESRNGAFGAFTFSEIGDVRPTNTMNRAASLGEKLLAFRGVTQLELHENCPVGRSWAHEAAPGSIWPYLVWDPSRSFIVTQPGTGGFAYGTGTSNRATSVNFRAPFSGTFRFTGSFGRWNVHRNAGNGVDVAVVRNDEVGNPSFAQTISSDHHVDQASPFIGSGAAAFDVTMAMTSGELVRFLVYPDSQGQDGTFDITALKVTASLAGRTAIAVRPGSTAHGAWLIPRFRVFGRGFRSVSSMPASRGRASDALDPLPVVRVGGALATEVEVEGDEVISARAPSLQPGIYDITLDFGSERVALPGAFTVLAVDPQSTSDTDGDGLPDAYEASFGLEILLADGDADADGDGASNRDEFAARTHPRGSPDAVRLLAEGASGSFFSTELALLNPGPRTATVQLRFLRRSDGPLVHTLTIPPRTRRTLVSAEVPGLATAEFSTVVESDVPLVVDRTMTWDPSSYGGHAETAVTAPALTWYLAEGATHSGFDLFYLLQNPHAAEVPVQVRYLRPTGPPLEKSYRLPPGSRTNIWVDYEEFPGMGQALADTDVSAVIEVLNDQPIIVERAMYRDVAGQSFGAGHGSAGVTAPATRWFLAEGATGPYFDLFVLIANPGPTDAQVEAEYLLPDGSTIVKHYTVAAQSRFNIWVDHEDARLANTAVSSTFRSTNEVPVIVERAMWWPGPNWYEAHNSPGVTTAGTRWALAAGEVGGIRAAETYILVANVSATPANVTVTLIFEDGSTAQRTYRDLPGRSRFNVPVGIDFPEAVGRKFGAIVESIGAPPAEIVVERAVYWDAGGQHWAAGTNAVATRLPE